MLVDSSNSAAGSTVTGAIQQASQATGTSFNYLLATAQVKSGLNAMAGAAEQPRPPADCSSSSNRPGLRP